MKHRTLFAVVLFVAFVLVFTFNDKVVHNDLYGYGLVFDDGWAVPYWVNYFVMYQLAIVSLTFLCQNRMFFVFAELFTVLTVQDIVYFLWSGYFPVGEWVWMWQYGLFGTWNTVLQFIVAGLLLTSLLFYSVFWVRRNGVKAVFS